MNDRVEPQAYCYPYPRPAVTVDVVLFGVLEQRLHVLLIERGREPFVGRWALPGGFVDQDEDLRAAAARELQEETGVNDIYLEQLHTFGEPGRDPRGHVVSVAYLSLVSTERVQTCLILGGDDAAAAGWHPVDDLPRLAFDHDRIVSHALLHLRGKLESTALAFLLLPAEFTLSELQHVYECVLNETLDKRNFRRKILATTVGGQLVIEDTGTCRAGDHRPARLYRFVAEALELDNARGRSLSYRGSFSARNTNSLR